MTVTLEHLDAAAPLESVPERITSSRGIIALLLLIIPLSQIGLDVYTPALPQMAAEFSASNDFVQNTVTAYLLGMSVAFLPVGLIADALGRRRVLLAGLGLVIATSIGCAVAPNLFVLLGMRFVQGIGASRLPAPGGRHRRRLFPRGQAGVGVGAVRRCMGAAPVLAPALGGFVVQMASWRVVFMLLAAFAAGVAMLVMKLLCPKRCTRTCRTPVDLGAAVRVPCGKRSSTGSSLDSS